MNTITENPFKVNQRVSVVRHKHGWSDGDIKGKIKTINFRKTGTAYYTVLGDDGFEYEILKSKDIKAI